MTETRLPSACTCSAVGPIHREWCLVYREPDPEQHEFERLRADLERVTRERDELRAKHEQLQARYQESMRTWTGKASELELRVDYLREVLEHLANSCDPAGLRGVDRNTLCSTVDYVWRTAVVARETTPPSKDMERLDALEALHKAAREYAYAVGLDHYEGCDEEANRDCNCPYSSELTAALRRLA